MSSKQYLPSLDTDGWVKTSVKVADYLISHFFLSDYSQTSMFPGNVASFAWILQRYQSDLTRIQTETQDTLTSYFSKYFKEVEVQVTELDNPESINDHHLSLYLTFVDEAGVKHNLSRMIKYTGMKVTEIIAVINEG